MHRHNHSRVQGNWVWRLANLAVVLPLSGCASATAFQEVYCIAAGKKPPSEKYQLCVPIESATEGAPGAKANASPTPALPSSGPSTPAGSGARLATAAPVFPDKPNANLYNFDKDKSWVPTPCQAVVLTNAINECRKINNTALWAQRAYLPLGIVGVAVGAASGTEAAKALGSVALYGAFAGKASETTLGLFGAPPTTPIKNMIEAAQSYAQVNQNIMPPTTADYLNEPYTLGYGMQPVLLAQRLYFLVTSTTRA
jgi:hypothetical protein